MHDHTKMHVFLKYQGFQDTSLRIQIWQRPFNPTSFISKYQGFQNISSLDSDLAETV